jgi:hypothetical protein
MHMIFSYICHTNELTKFKKNLKNHTYSFDPISSLYKILILNSLYFSYRNENFLTNLCV